jgi:hypothetical protein
VDSGLVVLEVLVAMFPVWRTRALIQRNALRQIEPPNPSDTAQREKILAAAFMNLLTLPSMGPLLMSQPREAHLMAFSTALTTSAATDQ